MNEAYRTEITAKTKAAKFKKTTVNTVARDGQTPVTLTGIAHAGLLIHTDYRNHPDKGYFISHVASGKCLGWTPLRTQIDAKATVVRLALLGDWHQNTDEFVSAMAKPAVALLMHCVSNGAFTPLPEPEKVPANAYWQSKITEQTRRVFDAQINAGIAANYDAELGSSYADPGASRY